MKFCTVPDCKNKRCDAPAVAKLEGNFNWLVCARHLAVAKANGAPFRRLRSRVEDYRPEVVVA